MLNDREVRLLELLAQLTPEQLDGVRDFVHTMATPVVIEAEGKKEESRED